MSADDPILQAALAHRLITKRQHAFILDELINFPGQSAKELLLRKRFLTPAQLQKLEANPTETQGPAAVPSSSAINEEPTVHLRPVSPTPSAQPTPSAPSYQPPQYTPQMEPPTPAPAPEAPPIESYRSSTSIETSPTGVTAPTAPTAPTGPTAATGPSGGSSFDVSAFSAGAVSSTYSQPKKLKDLLRLARHWGCSDLHLSVGRPPFVRINGEVRYMEMDPLVPEATEELILSALTEDQKATLVETLNLDFALELPRVGRHRCNVFRQRLGWDAVFRIVPDSLPTFENLGLPPSVKTLTEYQQGLVLVTGPARSGKTSTLAAMVDMVNRTRNDHIITVEDPIEYVHPPVACQVTQREIGMHSKAFSTALRAALREDPDIIMVGELRDLETISTSITAAETGHLVFGTLHTGNAARTVSRILDVYPSLQREQITVMLSESLRGVISQLLLPRADQNGLALALEVLIVTPGVSTVIKEGKLVQLTSLMQSGKKIGMQAMDDSIMDLLKANIITGAIAYRYAENKAPFEMYKNNN